MLALIQRVTRASVTINSERVAEIGHGMLILLGIMKTDAAADAEYLARRTASLRIFDDAGGVPNISLIDTAGEALVVSQFTLCADTRKGNRPSYIDAAPPDMAEPLYNLFVERLRSHVGAEQVQTGVFRAMMEVALVNSGPHTVILHSR